MICLVTTHRTLRRPINVITDIWVGIFLEIMIAHRDGTWITWLDTPCNVNYTPFKFDIQKEE